MWLADLPYCTDSAVPFEALADRPWSIFIDSGRPFSNQGRYDILAADPIATITTWGAMTESRLHGLTRISPEDPFRLLRDLLDQTDSGRERDAAGLPFTGGALGYFAYDLGRRLERLPATAHDAERLPDMAIGIYDCAIVVDHEARRTVLVGYGTDDRTHERWKEWLALFARPVAPRRRVPFRALTPARSNLDRPQYAHAFHRILDYIRAGDCYQVNLAQRFHASVEGDPWLAYVRLRAINPAPFAAYLNLPWAQILSASPERFLQCRAGRVETKPIKGTRRRHPDLARDREAGDELRASPKDRAENVMIVDLLRNDLGRVCETGSVRVPALCALESFATVHHLVSTVTGRLAPDRHALDLLRACFPGGSITGAPKIRAMEIIEELEPHRRGVYCGSIGYIGFDGQMDTNIAIRTLVHSQGELRFWAGGGITADSEMEAEYQETFDKAEALLALLKHGGIGHVGGQDRR